MFILLELLHLTTSVYPQKPISKLLLFPNMFLRSILLAGGLALTAVNCYKLDFYNSASGSCAGEALGSWGGIPGSGCRRDYADYAQDVLIIANNDHDQESEVAFYSSSNCNEADVINVAQGGCLTVMSKISAYKSFQIVRRGSAQKRESLNPEVSARTKNRKSRKGDDETPIGHGVTFEHANATWVWHQIADGAWTGIPIEEWDDTVHIASNISLEDAPRNDTKYFKDYLENHGVRTPILDERDLSGFCKTALQCSMSLPYNGVQGLRNWGGPLVDTIAQAAGPAGKSVWDFLQQPFAATVVGGGIVGYGVMWINNRWAPGKKETPETCSTFGSQADVLKGAIAEVVYFSDLEAVELTLEMADGSYSTIRVAVSAHGTKAECGLPPVHTKGQGN